MRNGDEIITENKSKASHFNSHFLSFSSIDTSSASLPNQRYCTDSEKNDIRTTDQEVMDMIKTLKSGKATGPDGVSSKLLREAAPSIAAPLCRLFNFSFEKGHVPSIWKQANVVPIFKKGDKSLVTNYRPISLTSVVIKILEKNCIQARS